MYKKKYIKIKDKFSDESKKQKNIGNTLVLLYCIFSFIFLLVIASFKPGYL